MSSSGHVDKRDFDANRPLLENENIDGPNLGSNPTIGRSRAGSRRSRRSSRSGLGATSDDGLLSDVVDGIVERDRRKMHKEVIRVISFVWGIITWYEFRVCGCGTDYVWSLTHSL
jgi:hypothetical protein